MHYIRNRKYGNPLVTKRKREYHGGYKHELYPVWQAMKYRCHNPNSIKYKYYGGRGIEVCERWRHSFANFLADVGERPEGMTVDRIDNNRGYSPDNVRWATMMTQVHNRRISRNSNT